MMIDIPALIEAHRADLRELGEFNAYRLLAGRIEAVRQEALQIKRVSRETALSALTTAAPAVKWVVDHAPRHDAHDQEHAKFALQHIRAAISELRR